MSSSRLKEKDIESQLCNASDSESGSNMSDNDVELSKLVFQCKKKLKKHHLSKNKSVGGLPSSSKKRSNSKDQGKRNRIKDLEKNQTTQITPTNKRKRKLDYCEVIPLKIACSPSSKASAVLLSKLYKSDSSLKEGILECISSSLSKKEKVDSHVTDLNELTPDKSSNQLSAKKNLFPVNNSCKTSKLFSTVLLLEKCSPPKTSQKTCDNSESKQSESLVICKTDNKRLTPQKQTKNTCEEVDDGSKSTNEASDTEELLDNSEDESKTFQSLNESSPSKKHNVGSGYSSTQTEKLTNSSSKSSPSTAKFSDMSLLKPSLRNRTPQKESRNSPRNLDSKRFTSFESHSTSKEKQKTCENIQLATCKTDNEVLTLQKATRNAHEQLDDNSENDSESTPKMSDTEDSSDNTEDESKTFQSLNESSPSKKNNVGSGYSSTQTQKLTRSSSKSCSSPGLLDNTGLFKLALRSRTPQKRSKDSPQNYDLKKQSNHERVSTSKKKQKMCENIQSKQSKSLETYKTDNKLLTPQKRPSNISEQMNEDSEDDSESTAKMSDTEDLLDNTEGESKTVQSLNESSPLRKPDAKCSYSTTQTHKLTRSSSKLCSRSTMPDETSLLKFCLRSNTPQKRNRGFPTKPELKRFSLNEDSDEVSSLPSRTRSRTQSTSDTNSTIPLHELCYNSESSLNRTPKKENKSSKKQKENQRDNSSDVEVNFTPDKVVQDGPTNLQCSRDVPLDHTRRVLSPLQKKDITVTTPVSKKNKGRGFLTPSMAKKEHKTSNRSESVMDATRKQLHISTIPKSLPCRDAEFSQIKSFLLRKIEHSAGGCMYISGVPGTGKTATVHAVIRALQEEVDEGEVPDFDFVEVNGLRLTEPRQAYVRIYQALTDEKRTPDQAQQLLNRRFSGTCKKSTIILVDELDYLCNKRQDVVYNILDWPTKRHSGLVVLTISNTIDLPERTLKGRVTSRMGLTRLMFHPYSHHQLREIVQDRLCGTTTFHPDAIQLVARKVAAVSGDARRALDICRRTTELVQPDEQVTPAHVERAVTQIFAGPRVLVIQKLCRLSQLVLRSLRDVNQRTGVDEATASQVYKHLEQICVLEGFMIPPVGIFLQACVGLVSMGLIMAEKGRLDITRKMSINVSSDDIHYALDNVQV